MSTVNRHTLVTSKERCVFRKATKCLTVTCPGKKFQFSYDDASSDCQEWLQAWLPTFVPSSSHCILMHSINAERGLELFELSVSGILSGLKNPFKVATARIYSWGTVDLHTSTYIEETRRVSSGPASVAALTYQPLSLPDAMKALRKSAATVSGHCIVHFAVESGGNIISLNLVPPLTKVNPILLNDLLLFRSCVISDSLEKKDSRLSSIVTPTHLEGGAYQLHFVTLDNGDSDFDFALSAWFGNSSSAHDDDAYFNPILQRTLPIPTVKTDLDKKEGYTCDAQLAERIQSTRYITEECVKLEKRKEEEGEDTPATPNPDEDLEVMDQSCKTIFSTLLGIKNLLAEHNKKEVKDNLPLKERSIPKTSDTNPDSGEGGDYKITSCTDLVALVKAKLSSLERERKKYERAVEDLKSAMADNKSEVGGDGGVDQPEAHSSRGSESSLCEASSSPRRAGEEDESGALSPSTPSLLSLDSTFSGTVYYDPFVSQVKQHIIKTNEEAKQMRHAIDVTYEALGGDSNIVVADPIVATKSLIELAGDTSESISQVKQLLELENDAVEHREKMSNVLDGVREKLKKVDQVQKEATTIVESFTKVEEEEASPEGKGTGVAAPRRHIERKRKPMSPEEAASDANMTLTSTLYFGVLPRSAMNNPSTSLVLGDITPEAVRKFKREMNEKLKELDEATEALQMCVRLMRPSGKTPTIHSELITTAVKLSQDASKALCLTDELFEDFGSEESPSPVSSISSLKADGTLKSKLSLAMRTEALVEAMKTLQSDNEICVEENENLQRRIVFLLQQEEKLQEERDAGVKREQYLNELQEKLDEVEEELLVREEELKNTQQQLEAANQKYSEAAQSATAKEAGRNKRDSLLQETEYLQQDIEDLLMTKGAIEEVLGDILVSLEGAVEDLEVQESAMLTEVQRAESVLRLSSTSAYAQEQKVLSKLLEVIEKQAN